MITDRCETYVRLHQEFLGNCYLLQHITSTVSRHGQQFSQNISFIEYNREINLVILSKYSTGLLRAPRASIFDSMGAKRFIFN